MLRNHTLIFKFSILQAIVESREDSILSADLHCYTKLSSSSMGIDDLIALAKKKGITTLAITDHDCQAGSIRGKIIAKRKGIEVIPAVEISARDKVLGHAVHIISYFSDHPDRLEEYCHKNTLASKKAVWRREWRRG